MANKNDIDLSNFDFGFSVVDEDELAVVQGAKTEVQEASSTAAQWQAQAEDGIRDRSPSRGLGDVYKRQYKELIKSCLLINTPTYCFTYVIKRILETFLKLFFIINIIFHTQFWWENSWNRKHVLSHWVR